MFIEPKVESRRIASFKAENFEFIHADDVDDHMFVIERRLSRHLYKFAKCEVADLSLRGVMQIIGRSKFFIICLSQSMMTQLSKDEGIQRMFKMLNIRHRAIFIKLTRCNEVVFGPHYHSESILIDMSGRCFEQGLAQLRTQIEIRLYPLDLD